MRLYPSERSLIAMALRAKAKSDRAHADTVAGTVLNAEGVEAAGEAAPIARQLAAILSLQARQCDTLAVRIEQED